MCARQNTSGNPLPPPPPALCTQCLADSNVGNRVKTCQWFRYIRVYLHSYPPPSLHLSVSTHLCVRQSAQLILLVTYTLGTISPTGPTSLPTLKFCQSFRRPAPVSLLVLLVIPSASAGPNDLCQPCQPVKASVSFQSVSSPGLTNLSILVVSPMCHFD